MKPKPFYIIALICCMSIFSSAKQSGKISSKSCKESAVKGMKETNAKAEGAEADVVSLSPLKFSI
ncbi:MAG TPA: hypothetical protein VK666_20295 [Chryseolinea sp.]|jgi:hypothetical protein|nr:hypothetical protein [Chryseolinea sp.]